MIFDLCEEEKKYSDLKEWMLEIRIGFQTVAMQQRKSNGKVGESSESKYKEAMMLVWSAAEMNFIKTVSESIPSSFSFVIWCW